MPAREEHVAIREAVPAGTGEDQWCPAVPPRGLQVKRGFLAEVRLTIANATLMGAICGGMFAAVVGLAALEILPRDGLDRLPELFVAGVLCVAGGALFGLVAGTMAALIAGLIEGAGAAWGYLFGPQDRGPG